MDRHSSCRTVLPLIYYLEANGIDPGELARGLPVDLTYLRNPGHWIPHALLLRIFTRCAEIFADPLIMHRIGQVAWIGQQQNVSSFAALLLIPDTLIRFAAGMAALTSRCVALGGECLASNEVRIWLRWHDHSLAHRHACLFTAGWLVGLPVQAWDTRAWIAEETCVCRRELDAIRKRAASHELVRATRFGARRCRFRLRWEEPELASHVKPFLASHAALIDGLLGALERSGLAPQEPQTPPPHGAACEPTTDRVGLFGRFNLSSREREIATKVIKGYANQRIAGELFISTETVKKHLNNIYQKMGIRSRGELTAKIYASV